MLYTAKGVAAIIGPWLGALIAERSGSWTLAFYGSALMALAAAGIAVHLRSVSAAAKQRASRVPATA